MSLGGDGTEAPGSEPQGVGASPPAESECPDGMPFQVSRSATFCQPERSVHNARLSHRVALGKMVGRIEIFAASLTVGGRSPRSRSG